MLLSPNVRLVAAALAVLPLAAAFVAAPNAAAHRNPLLASSSQPGELGDVVAVHMQDGVLGTLYANEPTICDPSVQQYSGYFTLGSTDKKYFYWFFASRNAPETDPTTMWLTGGPGCSSILALFAENGPCAVNADGATTRNNPYSWNTRSNLLYVDQPPGTGFSQGSYDHNQTEVANDMYSFLQAFFQAYPQYNTSFHVFGESYAGHYVPAISHRLYQANKAGEGTHIPLTGVAVGNGLTDPEVQYAYYPIMAYNSTTAPSVIGKAKYTLMEAAVPVCTRAIHACQTDSSKCSTAFVTCNLALTSPVQATGINPYDMRIKCEYGNLCYNFTNVEAYLNRADVQKAIGVSKKWESCNMQVNQLFRGDWMHNFQKCLPDMLADGIRVLIYAGDVDFICNWLGNKAWTLKFDWAGHTAFNSAPDTPWAVDGKQAGLIRSTHNMTFLQVFEAGHMVPMDQPKAALQMLDAFLEDTLH